MEQVTANYEFIGQLTVFFMLTIPVLLGLVFGLEWMFALLTRTPNQVGSLDMPEWDGGFDGERELRRRYGIHPPPKEK
jgi:hypothetical protein